MESRLYQLNKNIKALCISFLIVLSIGVTMGMIYIYLTTSMTIDGTEVRYAGDNIPENFDPDIDVLENHPKSILELVSHAHSHIISFAFIFFLTALIFEKTSIITGKWKRALMIEAFISIILTFGGFFLIRFIDRSFSYLVITSSTIMYLSFYIMIGVCLYELIFVKDEQKK
tara:strand:+ start:82 stop:597 length:516 start_codon:yes stop_codon:yes gene_type:complete